MSGWLSLVEVAFPWMIVALSAMVAGFSIYNWLAAQAAARSYEQDLRQWKEAAAVLTRQIDDLVGLVAMSSGAGASVSAGVGSNNVRSVVPATGSGPPARDEISSR